MNNHICQDSTFIDLKLYQYGQQKCEPFYCYGPAMRQNYLIHYVISGEGYFESAKSNATYEVSEGQAFLICPGDVCAYYASEFKPWHYVWLEFNGLQVKDCLLKAGLTEEQPIFVPKNPSQPSAVCESLIYLCENPNATAYEQLAKGWLFLDALIKESSRSQTTYVQDPRRRYVDVATAYVGSAYQNDNLTVDDISAYCKIDRSYLNRLFREYMDCSTQEFLIKYRMSMACALLRQPDLPIGKIASSVGYSNQLHFSRAFRKQFGVSPTAWRQQIFEEENDGLQI